MKEKITQNAYGRVSELFLVFLQFGPQVVFVHVQRNIFVDQRADERHQNRILRPLPQNLSQLVAIEDNRVDKQKIKRFLLSLDSVSDIKAQLVHVDLENVDHVIDRGQVLEYQVEAVGKKVVWQFAGEVAEYSLEHDGDKELLLFGFGEEDSDVVAAQVAVDVEALVEEELDELLAVNAADGLLEQGVLDLDLCVAVALKDLCERQIGAVPVQGQAEIALDLGLPLLA